MHDVRSARAFGLVSSFRLFFTRMYFSIASGVLALAHQLVPVLLQLLGAAQRVILPPPSAGSSRRCTGSSASRRPCWPSPRPRASCPPRSCSSSARPRRGACRRRPSKPPSSASGPARFFVARGALRSGTRRGGSGAGAGKGRQRVRRPRRSRGSVERRFACVATARASPRSRVPPLSGMKVEEAHTRHDRSRRAIWGHAPSARGSCWPSASARTPSSRVIMLGSMMAERCVRADAATARAVSSAASTLRTASNGRRNK